MSKDKDIHEKFVDFLNQYGLLDKFKTNLYKSKQTPLEKFTSQYKEHPREFTNYCFGWSSTPEKEDLWYTIHLRWGEFLGKIPPIMRINLNERNKEYQLDTFEAKYRSNIDEEEEEDEYEENYDEEDYDEDYDEGEDY